MSTRIGGRYELVRQIGVGGMGRVFQAVDIQTGKPVAAKIMLASSQDGLETLLRFYQEGAVLSALKHPNIVEVYGTFAEEGTCCIVMELLEGHSLADVLRSQRLSLPHIKEIGRQVASALAHAHSLGIIHRDVKPDNIMLIGSDRVKVTDFGIARILNPGSTLNTMTKAGMSIGTPLYMAPEQIEGRKIDGRADIYSLGAVLYEMVTGRPPFEGEDPLTIAFKHVHKAPAPPGQINTALPMDWEALILRALAKNPDERFQTAAAFEGAIASLGTAPSSPESRSQLTEPVRTPLEGQSPFPVFGAVAPTGGSAPNPGGPQPPVWQAPTPRAYPSLPPEGEAPRSPYSGGGAGFPPGTAPVPPSGGPSRRSWWIIAAAVLAVMTAGGVAFAVTRFETGHGAASATSTPLPVATPTLAPTSTNVPVNTPTSAPVPTPTTAPPPTPTSVPVGDGQAAVTQALANYHDAAQAAYGQNHDYSSVNGAMTGIARTAILCIARDKANSLEKTGAYFTQNVLVSKLVYYHVNGSTATAVIDRHDILTLHRQDGSTSDTDETYTVTYTLVNRSSSWLVSDYSTTAATGNSSASEDAKPCTG